MVLGVEKNTGFCIGLDRCGVRSMRCGGNDKCCLTHNEYLCHKGGPFYFLISSRITSLAEDGVSTMSPLNKRCSTTNVRLW